jgi:quercetin dioxygenase-like cupin family protein
MDGRETTYERWMREEGLPVVRGHGVTDVRALELAPWRRMGGRGAYIQLEGMEGLTGMYVTEIPPGGALEPEKHLYDKLVYALSGRGITQVWSHDGAEQKNYFEWQAGALFAPPINTWHRIVNTSGSEPVRLLCVTNAPLIMDVFHNTDFVFNAPYVFDDRYDGSPDYFRVGERRTYETNWAAVPAWDTNLIPDVPGADLVLLNEVGAGASSVVYEMAGNVLVGHMAEFPVGRYKKAHYHGGGAILFIVRSQGYTLMWPRELGPHPYENGHEAEVVRVDWQVGSVFSPPTAWFHQHFNTGPEPARQLAFRYGSHKYGVQFHDLHSGAGARQSLRKGGTQIEYDDEDPGIRRVFQEALADNGVPYAMADAFSAVSR